MVPQGSLVPGDTLPIITGREPNRCLSDPIQGQNLQSWYYSVTRNFGDRTKRLRISRLANCYNFKPQSYAKFSKLRNPPPSPSGIENVETIHFPIAGSATYLSFT